MKHRATYSAEDNKLRIYPGQRLDDELGERYADFKSAGYKWAAKQECFVCPRWTPAAEDWALALADEIEDEDYSPEERSADRAERFGCYLDKRRDEAHGYADSYESGPAVFAHQSTARAERQAARHDRQRQHALNQWSKAEYWQYRTAGVIRHALFKSSAKVRRGRLLRLEAEQRKNAKAIAEYAKRHKLWEKIAYEPDAGKATQWAKAFTGSDYGQSWEYEHPRTGKRSSLYYLLGDDIDPITGHEAATIWLANKHTPGDQESYPERWARHYELRIGYEKAMLEAEGGMAADVDIEPGGWVCGVSPICCISQVPGGWVQVQGVTKSPKTGRVVSVKVWGTYHAYGVEPKPRLMVCNVERLPENAYRTPTDEERVAFAANKKAEKASKKSVSTINPTDTDAERLQDYLNGKAAAEAKGKGREPKRKQVERTTQATFSRYNSQESVYSIKQYELGGAIFKLRVRNTYFSDYYAAETVLILTDKPQKPLPINWEQLLPVEELAEAV